MLKSFSLSNALKMNIYIIEENRYGISIIIKPVLSLKKHLLQANRAQQVHANERKERYE